jgi:invasion protein IalB
MKNSNRTLSAAFAAVAMVATAFIATPVLAKSAKCTAVPVPGQPGHYIVVCTRARP